MDRGQGMEMEEEEWIGERGMAIRGMDREEEEWIGEEEWEGRKKNGWGRGMDRGKRN